MGAGLGRARAAIKWLFNGFTAPTNYTSGPLLVEDHTGTLVTGGADVVTIPGARLATTVAQGAKLGAELITAAADREFSSDTGFWTKGANTQITGGAVSIINGVTDNDGIWKNGLVTAGKRYRVEYSITEITVGSVYVYSGSTGEISPPRTQVGTYIEELLSTGGFLQFLAASSGTTATIDNISVKEVIPTWLLTDSEGAQLFTSQTLDGFTDYSVDPDYKGMMVMPARTNKSTCRKANPTDTSNVSTLGDPAAVLSTVSDTTAIASANLDNVCTSGTVYQLDNSAGVANAYAWIGGEAGATGNHAISVYARMVTGTGLLDDDSGMNLYTFTNTGYERKEIIRNIAPSTRQMLVGVQAGAVIRFILMQFESDFTTPVIVDPDNDTLTTVTRSATVPAFNSADRLRANDWAATGIVIPWAAGQDFASYLNSLVVSGVNELQAYVDTNFVRFNKRISGGNTTVSSAYTHTKGTPFQYMIYQHSTHGMGLKVREYTGGAWQAWSDWDVNVDTQDAPIADTLQIGARNGAGQFAGTYPVTATTFLNQSFATAGALQTYLATNAKWTLIGG